MNSLNLHDLTDLLHELASFAALSEAAVLVGCLALSWGACLALRRMLPVDGAVLFGRRVVDGVLFPVLALLFALAARHLLMDSSRVAVFKLAIPILMSLVLIRLTVRVLSAAFPHSAVMRAIERTVSWLAWAVMVLWVTGVMPAVLNELDGVDVKIGASTVTLRNVVEGTLTAAVVMVLALWLSSVIEKKITRGTGNDLSVRKMISNIVRAGLLFVGLMFAMSAIGIDLTALSVLGGAVGVGLGFGLQKIASNYVSGFVILAERSIRIGDTVKVDNFEGTVTDIRTRYTMVRSATGREAIVPNEMLITQRVENSSAADLRTAVTSTLLVAHGTDVRALQAQLLDAVRSLPRVIADPAPAVQLSAFLPEGLEITVQVSIADPDKGTGSVKSEVNFAVLAALDASGVRLAAPLSPAPVG